MIQTLRLAALICFSFSVLIYALVMTMHASPDVLNSIAALGAAWWTVGVMAGGASLVTARVTVRNNDE
jgi:uncharacterized MnhB-related membrane protein